MGKLTLRNLPSKSETMAKLQQLVPTPGPKGPESMGTRVLQQPQLAVIYAGFANYLVSDLQLVFILGCISGPGSYRLKGVAEFLIFFL